MTIDVIDPSLHVSTIPTTYTGPGTVVGHTRQGGNETEVDGYFTSTGNATQVNVGFKPTRVKVVNTTDVIEWEWKLGMLATHTLKTVAAGTVTDDTSSAILPTEQGGTTDIAGNWIVTFSAALCGTSKNITFSIEG